MAIAYPFERLRRLSLRDAAFESAIARWIGAQPTRTRLDGLLGGPVRVETRAAGARDPNAATCEVRIGGGSIEVLGGSLAVRAIAQRVLGGPAELAAPRPLGAVEHAIWALVVATALEDLGVAGEVWPCEPSVALADPASMYAIELAVVGAVTMHVTVRVPRALELRVAPARPIPAWAAQTRVDVPIVLGRCVLGRAALADLAVRQVITLEPTCELEILGGAVGVVIEPGAVVATVATGYVRRDMALPDDASIELTVGLGTTQLSLRAVFELAVGAIVPLGRPLAGPFEIRAAGRLVGRGELVDVDGELGVRVVSLSEE